MEEPDAVVLGGEFLGTLFALLPEHG